MAVKYDLAPFDVRLWTGWMKPTKWLFLPEARTGSGAMNSTREEQQQQCTESTTTALRMQIRPLGQI